MNAAFEAVVNAMAHRDYSVYGSRIRLHLFADRLEIFSPGEIPNTLTGEGVPIIISESEKLAGRRPEYRMLDESELMLTIFAAKSPHLDATDD